MGSKLKKGMSKEARKENLVLYLIFLPVFVHLFIFAYIPMYGIVIAFQDYRPGSNFLSLDSSIEWVGFKHFADFISSYYFWRLIRNTVVLSGLQLSLGFFIPIIFALLMNEIRQMYYKKIIQTASYLPHFISTVVVAGMVLTLLSEKGMINQLLVLLGLNPINYNIQPGLFPWVYVITNIWKSFGWSSIIYFATISGIDPEILEAAKVDGASRWKRVMHITLPAIRGTILILLIFAIGGLLGANSEFILLMYNPAIYETSDVIGTYIYRSGLLEGNFSQTTAIGIFMTTINFSLLYFANAMARKFEGYSLW